MSKREIEWHTRRIKNVEMYEGISKSIRNALKVIDYDPKSVMDLGCSVGMLLKALNIEDSIGIESSRFAKDNCVIQKEDFILADLNDHNICENVDIRPFDLIISQEVAEHLGNSGTNALECNMPIVEVINLCAHKDSVLVFGAAYKGQPGRGHINCHNARYWQEVFEMRGWEYNHRMTVVFAASLISNTNMEIWHRNHTNCYLNTMFFIRKNRGL